MKIGSRKPKKGRRTGGWRGKLHKKKNKRRAQQVRKKDMKLKKLKMSKLEVVVK